MEKIKKEPGHPEGGEPEFDWTRFRTFARLDKKTDESLSRYFRSFVAMCRRVCQLRPGPVEGECYLINHPNMVISIICGVILPVVAMSDAQYL